MQTSGRSRVLAIGCGAGLTIIALALVVLAHFWKREVTIDEVVVEGNQILTTSEILRLAEISAGSSLYEIDLFGIQQRILANPFVRSAAVCRDASGRVELTVAERSPVAALMDGVLKYVDAEGICLPPHASGGIFDIPLITGDLGNVLLRAGAHVEGERMGEALHCLKVLESYQEIYRRVSEIHLLRKGGIVLLMVEGGVPVYIGENDCAGRIAALTAFWKQVVMIQGAVDLEWVNLRYDGQVVARWKGHSDGGV
jgi:cell division protein FtsQ